VFDFWFFTKNFILRAWILIRIRIRTFFRIRVQPKHSDYFGFGSTTLALGKPSLVIWRIVWEKGKLIFLLSRPAALCIDCDATSDVSSVHARSCTGTVNWYSQDMSTVCTGTYPMISMLVTQFYGPCNTALLKICVSCIDKALRWTTFEYWYLLKLTAPVSFNFVALSQPPSRDSSLYINFRIYCCRHNIYYGNRPGQGEQPLWRSGLLPREPYQTPPTGSGFWKAHYTGKVFDITRVSGRTCGTGTCTCMINIPIAHQKLPV
jgi:hypothetical protein